MLRAIRAVPAALLALPLTSSASGPPATPAATDPAAYRREVESWRAGRLARLTSGTGWLTVVGLFWLEPGKNAVGADPGNRVVLPQGKAPAYAGTLDRDGDAVTFHAAPGAGVTSGGRAVATLPLRSDAEGEPTILSIGSVSFFVIRRGERLGARVRDAESAARRSFHGIAAFPVDPKWRVEARFEPYSPPKRVAIPTILGTTEFEECPGALVFELEGKTHRLDPVLERGETDFFVIFADRTNGTDTYGAGRFLYAAPPVGGRTVIDFNEAYNPPCAFTAFATCPLPPPQNRLPLRVEAGEKAYAHE